ncbi:MAG: TldD/PmbA family protein [Chloroflexota bacterium]
MRERLANAVRGRDADYVEVRVEESDSSRLLFRGKELEDVARTVNMGGCVRALAKGGWGFTSFNDLSSLEEMVDLAIRQAKLVPATEGTLAEAPVVEDVVPLALKRDPREVPLADKVHLFEEYNKIILGKDPAIQTTQVGYGDNYRKTYLATSQGTYVEQERMQIRGVFVAMARRDAQIEQAHEVVSTIDDYGRLEGLHEQVEDVAKRAVGLLSAQPVKAGEYTVILDPRLAGVFAHEAFGHLSEADHVYENERLRDILVLGRRFGEDYLTISDGASVPGQRGSYKYDDEGVPASITPLIKNGVLVGRLHSRETAAKMGEQVTGNARAISYRFRPIVRMTNTFIEQGTVPFADMLADVKEGVYCRDTHGGETSMEMFTFSAEEAFMIRNGRLAEPLRGVLLSGNVFTTLANIDAVGSDLSWGGGGNCGKGEQSPLPVGLGSPHIRIRRCVVGGR